MIDWKIWKRGQATIFVVVAIVIVAGLGVFFAFRGNLFGGDNVGPEFAPIYNFYLGCIEDEVNGAIDLIEIQGGRIDVGEYVPGSEFSPFSSQLNFFGFPVPYWYYVAGNNVVKENIPTKRSIQRDISEYVAENIERCDFTSFYKQGFYIDLPEVEDIVVETVVEDDLVNVKLTGSVSSAREDRTARKNVHEVSVESKLGSLYDSAREIYEKEVSEAFLEEYAVDVLWNYAPVDGVEISCSPEIWKAGEVVEGLQEGLEANIASIKLRGDYYELDEQKDNYFVVDYDVPFGQSVNFLYSKRWPGKFEITPAEGELMIARPVGNQEGMGAMGFCYVPYHFVYDVSFPVLIQVSEGSEIFQFPVAVVIDNNVPREAVLMSMEQDEGVDICEVSEGSVEVYTYDNELNPVEAKVSYQCFDSVCDIGESVFDGSYAIASGRIPLCVNGFLIAKAEGFADKRVLFSSNSESVADIILDREYELDVELRVGGRAVGSDETGIVQFISDDYSGSMVLPGDEKIVLKEGSYEIDVQVYGNSKIRIPTSSKTECYEASRGGVAGLFGLTKEECVDIEIPAFDIDSALVGGGKSNTYILESELKSGRLVIDVDALPRPDSFEQLQYNYGIFENYNVGLSFG